ncbi:MAG: hypothetical protein NTW05_16255 [Pseudonocardiales bacterium]|nr:hypothetical protein [Pseudonocardiales bacterium]
MSPEERAAYRAFVREHHPDRGGDPDAFVAGLARFRAGPAGRPPTGDDPGDDADDPRYDAPVEIVTPLPLPVRVAVALIRTLRSHRARRVE